MRGTGSPAAPFGLSRLAEPAPRRAFSHPLLPHRPLAGPPLPLMSSRRIAAVTWRAARAMAVRGGGGMVPRAAPAVARARLTPSLPFHADGTVQ